MLARAPPNWEPVAGARSECAKKLVCRQCLVLVRTPPNWKPLTGASKHLTCKRGSVGQSEGLSIPRSSVRFRLKPDTSNSHEFELHRPSNKGTKLLLKVIKAIIIIPNIGLIQRSNTKDSLRECLRAGCCRTSLLLHTTCVCT